MVIFQNQTIRNSIFQYSLALSITVVISKIIMHSLKIIIFTTNMTIYVTFNDDLILYWDFLHQLNYAILKLFLSLFILTSMGEGININDIINFSSYDELDFYSHVTLSCNHENILFQYLIKNNSKTNSVLTNKCIPEFVSSVPNVSVPFTNPLSFL